MAESTLLLALIDALAEQAARDYLTAQAALLQSDEAVRSERVPLRAMDDAA